MKSFFSLLLVSSLVCLQAAKLVEPKSYNLQKDQMVKILFKSEGQEHLLTFRWTLYTDKALVVHESYDRFVGQHILYTGFGSQSFRKRLLNSKNSELDVPYALVVFKKFDEGAHTAQMDFFLIDREKRVVVDYLTEK
ncbi:MAG: hypothetical protein PHO27_07845 [Sulfuricurvum sp.]|nr:hypothetical protein [Sulfuricurvum sp.]